MCSKEGPSLPELALWGWRCPAVRALPAPGRLEQPTVGQRGTLALGAGGSSSWEKTRSSGCSGQAGGACHALKRMGAVRKDGYCELSPSSQASVLQLPVVVMLHPGSRQFQHTASTHTAPPQSHGISAVCCGKHTGSSQNPIDVTLLWVERSQPGRAETMAGFAEPRLVPHYCHEDLDAVRVSLCPDRSHEKREDTQHGSAGRAQCLLQGQSLCPAPARASGTRPSPKRPLDTERSTPLPKTFPLGKGVFPEKHCCRNALHS